MSIRAEISKSAVISQQAHCWRLWFNVVHRKSFIHSSRHCCLTSRHFLTCGSTYKLPSGSITNSTNRRCH